MLPFLPKIRVRDNSEVVTRTPDQGKEQGNQGLEACASALISAIEAKDTAGVAAALKDAYSICESGEQEYPEESNEEDTE